MAGGELRLGTGGHTHASSIQHQYNNTSSNVRYYMTTNAAEKAAQIEQQKRVTSEWKREDPSEQQKQVTSDREKEDPSEPTPVSFAAFVFRLSKSALHRIVRGFRILLPSTGKAADPVV